MRLYLRFGGHLVALSEGSNVLGRSSKCDVVVPDDVASRRHAELVIDNGRLSLCDLGSRNGLLLNDIPVVGIQEVQIGDRITIGSTELVVTEREERPSIQALSTARKAAKDSATKTDGTDVFGLLVKACREALDTNQIDDAVFACNNLMLSVQSAVERGQIPHQSVFHLAFEFGLMLVDRTGEQDWLDRVLGLAGSARLFLDRSQVNRVLGGVVRPSPASVSYYVSLVTDQAATDDDRWSLEQLKTLLPATTPSE